MGPRPIMDSSSSATRGFWPPRILMSASSRRSFGDRGGLGPGVAHREQVGGLVEVGELDVTALAGHAAGQAKGRRRSSSRRPHRAASLLPHLVSDHDPQVAGFGDLAQSASPGVEAQQGDAPRLVAEGVEAGQAQGLDGARQSISMLVWASNRPARVPVTSWPRALRSSRVSSRNCRSVS